jgi:hypothetical protein
MCVRESAIEQAVGTLSDMTNAAEKCALELRKYANDRESELGQQIHTRDIQIQKLEQQVRLQERHTASACLKIGQMQKLGQLQRQRAVETEAKLSARCKELEERVLEMSRCQDLHRAHQLQVQEHLFQRDLKLCQAQMTLGKLRETKEQFNAEMSVLENQKLLENQKGA